MKLEAVKDRHAHIISTVIAERDDCVVTLELLTKLIGADADVLVCTFVSSLVPDMERPGRSSTLHEVPPLFIESRPRRAAEMCGLVWIQRPLMAINRRRIKFVP